MGVKPRLIRPRPIRDQTRLPYNDESDDLSQVSDQAILHEKYHYEKCDIQDSISIQSTTELSMQDNNFEEMRDIVLGMNEKESTVYHCNCKERRNVANNELSALWRRLLINWMYYVVDSCELQRHSVAAAAYFLDVAMLRELCKTREEHQLAAATSLQMALKTFDTAVIKLDKLVALGRGLFNEDDVAVMEMDIITSLDWNLHPPTIYCYMEHIEQLLPSGTSDSGREVIRRMAGVIAEELTLNESYIRYQPSLQGYCIFFVVINLVPKALFSDDFRDVFLFRLSKVMNIDAAASKISKVNRKIFKTLRSVKKLQTIIDISRIQSKETSLSVPIHSEMANKSKQAQKENQAKQQEQHSPRDVTEKLSITM